MLLALAGVFWSSKQGAKNRLWEIPTASGPKSDTSGGGAQSLSPNILFFALDAPLPPKQLPLQFKLQRPLSILIRKTVGSGVPPMYPITLNPL